MAKIDESTERGVSAVLRMKRSLELANDKKERLKNALARVKGNPDSEYAARLVQSARREAGRQDSVVRRQVGRIREMIGMAMDGDVTGLEEAVNEALRERIDEISQKLTQRYLEKNNDSRRNDWLIPAKGSTVNNVGHVWKPEDVAKAHHKAEKRAEGWNRAYDKLGRRGPDAAKVMATKPKRKGK